MQRFQSGVQPSVYAVSELYDRISTFDRLKEMMPDQIVNWKTQDERCAFTITGMADIEMSYLKLTPLSGVHIVSEKSPFDFEIIIDIEADGSEGAKCQTTILASLNTMLSMLASRPLKHLVESINKKIVE